MPYPSLLFGLLLSLSSLLSAQDYQKNIQSDFNDYWSLLADGNYEQAVDYLPPEFLELASREMTVEVMRSTFESPLFDIKIGQAELVTIPKPQKLEGKYYALVDHMSPVKMRLKKDDNLSEDNYNLQKEFFQKVFEQQFGPEQLSYDEETDFFTIRASKQLYAISENGQTDWKFIILLEEGGEYLQQFLPEALWQE